VKRFAAILLITLAFSVNACSNILVPLGLQDPPPIVTDSTYFNGQIEKLLDGVASNKSRSFRRAAVLGFVNTDGRMSELGKMLTTKFGERAIAKNQFRVIPSGQVSETLEALKINYTGKLKREQILSIGDALGADAVVTGVIYDLQKGSDVDVSVNVIQPGSGDLISAASVNIHRSKQVQTLISQF
jgi:hypothetical protein